MNDIRAHLIKAGIVKPNLLVVGKTAAKRAKRFAAAAQSRAAAKLDESVSSKSKAAKSAKRK